MDKKHRDRLANAERQARYAERQRAMGRLARKIWATDEEIAEMRKFLAILRRKNRILK